MEDIVVGGVEDFPDNGEKHRTCMRVAENVWLTLTVYTHNSARSLSIIGCLRRHTSHERPEEVWFAFGSTVYELTSAALCGGNRARVRV